MTEEMSKYREKATRFQKELTNLEIENETQAKQNRIKEEIIKELQHKSSKLNETLTIIKMETDELKSMGQEELSLVKSRLKETEDELIVLKHTRNSLVKEEMLDSNYRPTLTVHHSSVFTHSKSNRNLNHTTDPSEPEGMTQSYVSEHPQSHRILSTNVSSRDLHRTQAVKHFDLKDKRLLDRRFSFNKNMSPHDKELEEKLQQFLNKHKDSPLKQANTNPVKDNNGHKNKTEWFINVINSLDKKLKDIKTSMCKKN